ncbi:MAG TPA: gamma-glutamyltransferase, partial [Fimbriimonadaceae bacterium]|nr:gamma-glutamyltransferase [Fimbriimonadaceae bacterium]
HLQIEAMKVGFAEIFSHLSDPVTMRVPVSDLLDDGYLSKHAERVKKDRASVPSTLLASAPSTVYLCAADDEGMMVSFIQSNFNGFGSGIVIPGTGIAMQNRGSGFTLEPGHPNEAAPGKRPFHTIIPGFATQGDDPLMAFGVMGGHMQTQGHVQTMVRMFVYGQNPQAASDAPRWHVSESGDVLLEEGFDPDVARVLESRGHTVKSGQPSGLFGGGQFALRLEDGYCAASDHRKDGCALGF